MLEKMASLGNQYQPPHGSSRRTRRATGIKYFPEVQSVFCLYAADGGLDTITPNLQPPGS
jgi:hypothetical protein